MIIGNSIIDFAPKENNPRNSEGAFITLNDGTLMFCYTKYIGTEHRDSAYSVIAAVYSKDEGYTWGSERILFKPEEFDTKLKKCKNIMSISLLRMNDGAVGLFFLVRYDEGDMCEHLLRSYDEGKTWSAPTRCVPHHGYFVTNNDRVIRTASGRIILPGNFCRNANYYHACYFISDDDGFTFREAKQYCSVHGTSDSAGLQETGIVELGNGVLWSFSRTTLGRQYESFSYDEGETWSVPAPSYFTSPCSPLSMKRANNGALVAVWNPVPNYITRMYAKPTGGRTPLILSVSFDDGKTWCEPYIIEDDENSGYCYTAIHFMKKHLILAYCAGSVNDKSCLSRLRIKIIQNDEIGL